MGKISWQTMRLWLSCSDACHWSCLEWVSCNGWWTDKRHHQYSRKMAMKPDSLIRALAQHRRISQKLDKLQNTERHIQTTSCCCCFCCCPVSCCYLSHTTRHFISVRKKKSNKVPCLHLPLKWSVHYLNYSWNV